MCACSQLLVWCLVVPCLVKNKKHTWGSRHRCVSRAPLVIVAAVAAAIGIITAIVMVEPMVVVVVIIIVVVVVVVVDVGVAGG
jgi:hypothetical protein